MNKDGFEQDIKKVFKNYQPSPPSHLWDEIDSKLDMNKKSGWKTYVLYAASFALLLTFSLGGYLLFFDTQVPEQAKMETVSVPEQALALKPLEPITLSEKAGPKIYRKEEQLKRAIPSGEHEKAATADIHEEALTYKRMVKEPEEKSITEVPIKEKTKADFLFTDQREYVEIATFDHEILLKREPEKTIFYTTTAILESEDKDALPGLNRWSFGVKAAPQYANRLNSSDPDDLDRGKSIFEQNEKHLFTYNLGLNATYKINEKLSIESGLYYLQMGQSIRNIEVYFDEFSKTEQILLTSMGEINFYDQNLFLIDNSSDRIRNDDNQEEQNSDDLPRKGSRINQNIDFLEFPLFLRYNLHNRQTQIQLKGGVGFNYLVSNKVVLLRNSTKEHIGETALIRNWNMSISGGFAWKIPVTNKINFHIEPTASLFVTSMTTGREYNVYPFGISIYTGFSMAF